MSSITPARISGPQENECEIRAVCQSVNGRKRTRVLLADDDLAMLAATGKFLQADFDIVGIVSDVVSLIEAATELRPDVIVTDISMPKMNGLEAVGRFAVLCRGQSSCFLPHVGPMPIEEKRKALVQRATCSRPHFASN